jgi:hypothetical protein
VENLIRNYISGIGGHATRGKRKMQKQNGGLSVVSGQSSVGALCLVLWASYFGRWYVVSVLRS